MPLIKGDRTFCLVMEPFASCKTGLLAVCLIHYQKRGRNSHRRIKEKASLILRLDLKVGFAKDVDKMRVCRWGARKSDVLLGICNRENVLWRTSAW